jgi:hypothetical protein
LHDVIERILALEIWQLYSVHFSLHRIADVLKLFFSDHNLWCNISYLYLSSCHLKCVIQVKRYFEYSDPNGTVNEIWREIGQKLPLIQLMINREKRLVKRDSIEPDCSCLCTNQSTLFTSLWYRNRCCQGLVQMSPDVSGEGSFLRPEEWRMLTCSFIVWSRMKEPPCSLEGWFLTMHQGDRSWKCPRESSYTAKIAIDFLSYFLYNSSQVHTQFMPHSIWSVSILDFLVVECFIHVENKTYHNFVWFFHILVASFDN